MNSTEPRESSNGVLGFVSEHPVLTGIFATCIVGGAILGGVYLTEEWSLARRLAAGAVAGAGVALLTTAQRMIG